MHIETEQKIKEMLEKGHTPEYIANDMEISVRTVVRIRNKYWPEKEPDIKKQHQFPPELIAEWDKIHKKYGNTKGGK